MWALQFRKPNILILLCSEATSVKRLYHSKRDQIYSVVNADLFDNWESGYKKLCIFSFQEKDVTSEILIEYESHPQTVFAKIDKYIEAIWTIRCSALQITDREELSWIWQPLASRKRWFYLLALAIKTRDIRNLFSKIFVILFHYSYILYFWRDSLWYTKIFSVSLKISILILLFIMLYLLYL